MGLIRPRLTDHHGISVAQADLDFAIPLLDADIPLYVDPFLLWRSPSQQDQALHTALINSFNHLNRLVQKGQRDEAVRNLILASECDEVGLGTSASRVGKRMSKPTAEAVIRLYELIPEYGRGGFTHFEEIQLYVDGIAKDRISDITCSFLKSFLIDYTIDQCAQLGVPTVPTTVATLFDYKAQTFKLGVNVTLPVQPETGRPVLLVPKRWLRHIPWISFEDYFAAYCPKDEVVNQQGADDRVRVLTYNRENYGIVAEYIKAKERNADSCRNDPLFTQIPVLSAKRKFAEIKKLATGTTERADKQYEDAASQLLASLLYPHLDFADTQVRADSGVTIRDLIFYNNRSVDFLKDILDEFGSKQLVMELKNVAGIEREHINQLNRYLSNEFGSFGVFVTRNALPRAMFKNTIDLWSGQRRCIVALTDADLDLMVEVYESKQRLPIEVLKRCYTTFRRACPS
jgi:hypothetical protein